ncbi:MAG: hypothetical protein ISR58_12265 [Anaerolineales bacterium]|nr:hypothetical protein [Chloroflexota bacterium]MBL6981952.1 hypothetical protein [Anaerolineales bacterium]
MKRWEVISLFITGILLIILLAGLAIQNEYRLAKEETPEWIPVEWLTETPTITSTPGWWDALPTSSFSSPTPEPSSTPVE